jgi:hypothetical protein
MRRSTMCLQIRIADGLRTQSAERLITTAGAIINGLTGNPSFSSPSVDLKSEDSASRRRRSERSPGRTTCRDGNSVASIIRSLFLDISLSLEQFRNKHAAARSSADGVV